MDPVKEKEIEDEYLSSLMDLNVNSKPLINMLTMLAEENIEYAPVIVRAVEKHLAKVSPDVKLPILYLIDSIVKNVGNKYKQLFAQNIVNMFCGVFEKVNEKVREKMYSLRITWNEVFPQTKLYALDVKVNVMDNNWPITAKVLPKSVHVNPNFLKKSSSTAVTPPADAAKADLVKQMEAKERELLELQKRKIELEVLAYKKKIAEQEREIQGGIARSQPMAMQNPPGAMIPQGSHQMMQMQHPPPSHTGRVRITPINPAMLSARSRDPRLMRMKPHPTATTTATNTGMPQANLPLMSMANVTKSLPRIPKFSDKNSSRDHQDYHERDSRDRDPRNRRNRDRDDGSNSKSSKSNFSSKEKNKSSKSTDHRKKSGSSDESPRKKSEEEKKSSRNVHHKSPSSHSRLRSPKSPPKVTLNTDSQVKDVDLRLISGEPDMKPDSTTNHNIKSNKDKLLNKLLNGEVVKSSHDDDDDMITSDNEDSQADAKSPKQDTDLRFTEGNKKRSMENETLDSEPSTKKNRSDGDLLFGAKDVDLRTLGESAADKKTKTKDKADFEAVRAKLNATKEKNKLRGGIKLLDKIPKMPASENGTSDLVRKILNRKDKNKTEANEEIVSSRDTEELTVTEPIPKKRSRFTDPLDEKQEAADMGNMTAAELRQSSMASIPVRKEKRKETKWSQPPAPIQMNAGRPFIPQTLPQMMTTPRQFINPWELNPIIQAMRNQTQMPLVVPQSPSHPILNDKIRTLRLDGIKDHLLRFYNETAIIFNENGEPHDIKFSSGQSTVIIDDIYKVVLEFNDSYKPIVIDGKIHQIKFGTPTRELYIDDHFYECYFNNQPTQIVLEDKLRLVRIEGHAPEVKIGNRKRSDLVLGMVNVLIDAEIMVPVFLDTTVQYFEFKGKVFTLQFADFFLSVVINNEPFKVEFGGLPKNYMLNGAKHFLRFTDLPDDVHPGRVNLRGMRRTHLFRNCKTPPLMEDNYNQEHQQPSYHQQQMISVDQHLDISKLVENDMKIQPQMELPLLLPSNALGSNVIPGIGVNQQGAPALDVNINELFQKLVASGILSNNATSNSPPPTIVGDNKSENRTNDDSKRSNKSQSQSDEKRRINPVSLTRPETIKKRQQAIVDTLYSGIQCSSCGLRFPPEQTMKYSQHLDWHFRQNRRERDSQRRAHSRKWYYNQADWIKYEEIEDLEERERNFFETQQLEMEQADDSNQGRGSNQESAVISCPAGPDDVSRCCDMCHDKFEQFFNEETEEWHLRSALKVEDRFYHPICYEDYKSSLTLDESAFNEALTETTKIDDGNEEMLETTETTVKEEKPELGELEQISSENGIDDDDVIVLPPEEPIVTEIHDDQEVIEHLEENVVLHLNNTDDDVMIQEPKIETQLVDDDDDDYQHNVSEETPQMLVKIKEEPKDDGYEDFVNEEDAFVEVTAIANEDLQDDAYVHSPKPPFQPAQDENAVFDEASLVQTSNALSFDDNSHGFDDDGSRPDSNGGNAPVAVVGGKKRLKIVLSSLAQTNLTNKNFSNVTDPNENSNNEAINKLDSNNVEIQQTEHRTNDENIAGGSQQDGDPEMLFSVKPQLQGVKFERIPMPVRRGYENSGLCSIM